MFKLFFTALLFFVLIAAEINVEVGNNTLNYKGVETLHVRNTMCYGRDIKKVDWINVKIESKTENDFNIMFFRNNTDLHESIHKSKNGKFYFRQEVPLDLWEICIFTHKPNNTLDIKIEMIEVIHSYYIFKVILPIMIIIACIVWALIFFKVSIQDLKDRIYLKVE